MQTFYTFSMSLQEFYEESFRAEAGRSAAGMIDEVLNQSRGLAKFAQELKDRFLPDRDWQGLRVLETGAGRGGASLHLAQLGAEITLLDFSSSALEQARTLYAHAHLPVDTICGDVAHPELGLQGQFDLILDSHLLHCLTADPDRISYYRLIRDHLSERGIFMAETMVHRKSLFIPDSFMLDQKNVLWQMLGQWIPVRKIMDSLELEQELVRAGFRISYFYYYAQFGFVPHRSFLDLPAEILPAAVRFAVHKSEQNTF
jgi:SAM-dependent methyltransferase